jgi:hypothetical protein
MKARGSRHAERLNLHLLPLETQVEDMGHAKIKAAQILLPEDGVTTL